MIVIQARDLINGTCGAPILAPTVKIARRQIGRMINDNPLLKDHPDKVVLDVIDSWDPSFGMLVPDLQVRQSFSGTECLEEYLHALDAVNTPGEGELTSEDGDPE